MSALWCTGKDERRLTDFIAKVCDASAENEQFQVGHFSANQAAAKITGAFSLGRAPEGANAARLNVSEEEVRRMFKWANSDLVPKLRSRYDDFKLNDTSYRL